MADSEDRTLAPTERRRQRAREEGSVPLSREFVNAAGLAALVLVAAWIEPTTAGPFAEMLRDMLADTDGVPQRALHRAATAFAVGLTPFAIAALLAGAGAVLVQTGFLFNAHALVPDGGRVDPRRGLKRLLGLDNAVEALKALAKLGVLAWAVWSGLASLWPSVPASLLWSPDTAANRIGRSLVQVGVLVLAAQLVIAMLDVGWTRWRFTQRLRMSREELRQEARDTDGDPRIKGRLRQLRLARARRRMLAAVARSTVVVTNPTHFAIALAYERGGTAAPRVVAKGMDEVAARIRAAAETAGVPQVAHPPLARALFIVPLDAEVPPEHFRVVAEIIAYVWRLRSIARR